MMFLDRKQMICGLTNFYSEFRFGKFFCKSSVMVNEKIDLVTSFGENTQTKWLLSD